MAFKTIKAPHILLPKKGVNMNHYAVIACDQFTSEIDYWNDVKLLVGNDVSTFHMIFPEAYLEKVNEKEYIDSINKNIDSYLNDKSLIDIGPSMVLVERTTDYGTKRIGLVLAIDLEDYSYNRGVDCSIKASEATIIERIPPRLKIRKNAAIELPHTLLLFNDKDKEIIENLYANKDKLELLYDFELNQNGGHIKGYRIDDTDEVINKFEHLFNKNNDGLMFIVGDGNHSLATAKAHWESIKPTLSEEERLSHPARYALVEVNNVYDDGIKFEPIHRILFNVEDDFLEGLLKLLKGDNKSYVFSKKQGKKTILIPKNAAETYQNIQNYIDIYLKSHPTCSVDFIHDEDSLLRIAKNNESSLAIVMPSLGKGDIFDFVARDSVLPRKSFSMGHASEKRYYLEAKLIK